MAIQYKLIYIIIMILIYLAILAVIVLFIFLFASLFTKHQRPGTKQFLMDRSGTDLTQATLKFNIPGIMKHFLAPLRPHKHNFAYLPAIIFFIKHYYKVEG